MVALYLVEPGDVLFETKTVKRGHTTMTERVAYRVKVIEVHRDHIVASWNTNKPEKMYHQRVSRMTRTPPAGTAERRRHDEAMARATSKGVQA